MIGNKIRLARSNQGLSISELAQRAGIGKGHLSDIETGNVKSPGLETIIKLARILDVNIQELTETATVGDLEKYA